MSKRKREEDRTEPHSGGARLKEEYLDNVLQRSKQLLFQALKLARGFERQKLGRRQKTAKAADNDGDSKRLAAEVKALKALDISSTVENHLYKSLLQTKSIASAPGLQLNIQRRAREKSKPHDVAQANVQARLFNSQPVKKAMDDVMSSVRSSLGLEKVHNAKKRRMRKKDFEQQLETTDQADLERANGPTPERSPRKGALLPSVHDSSSEDRSEYDKFNSRLVGSSDESSDGDSISVDYKDLRTISARDSNQQFSLSPSPEFSVPSVAPYSPPSHKIRASETSTSALQSTTFIPSLMMGGYWSGSEPASGSEGSLGEQSSKNRRGQRERRLIAEKKFGQKAKHLKQHGQGQRQDRDRGWDPRKGAQTNETDEFGRMRRSRKGGSARVRQGPRPVKKRPVAGSGANSDPVGPRKPTIKVKPAEGPLHPSWQAAKKAKEQNQSATFQGKRMTFD
ncbi:MAG: hypothetical protein Q9178_002979 [Gyalolechia marmorata]